METFFAQPAVPPPPFSIRKMPKDFSPFRFLIFDITLSLCRLYAYVYTVSTILAGFFSSSNLSPPRTLIRCLFRISPFSWHFNEKESSARKINNTYLAETYTGYLF